MKVALAVMPASSVPGFFRLITTGKYWPVAEATGPIRVISPSKFFPGVASTVTGTCWPIASRGIASWETLPCSFRIACIIHGHQRCAGGGHATRVDAPAADDAVDGAGDCPVADLHLKQVGRRLGLGEAGPG